jgi:hypothetical protein
MAMRSSVFTKRISLLLLLLSTLGRAQEIQTIDLATSEVHPITAKVGNTCMIQLPVEAIATNVGDPVSWFVEKTERIVSIKPVQEGIRDTNLAIVTRQGVLNFSIHLAGSDERFTQSVRITKIVDDSKPLTLPSTQAQETLADTIIREIRIAQNYYALKSVHSREIANVEQKTHVREMGNSSYGCALLQSFRFPDTRHVVLHFITENKTELPITFDRRKTVVNIGDTFFAPIAVSLGNATLQPKRSSENFIILDGSNGLSPHQHFNIILSETSQSTN